MVEAEIEAVRARVGELEGVVAACSDVDASSSAVASVVSATCSQLAGLSSVVRDLHRIVDDEPSLPCQLLNWNFGRCVSYLRMWAAQRFHTPLVDVRAVFTVLPLDVAPFPHQIPLLGFTVVGCGWDAVAAKLDYCGSTNEIRLCLSFEAVLETEKQPKNSLRVPIFTTPAELRNDLPSSTVTLLFGSGSATDYILRKVHVRPAVF